MADEHKASRARAAERVKLYREQSGLRAQQSAGVKLNITIGDATYFYALKATPIKLSLSTKASAFQQRACYLPQVASQDLSWSNPQAVICDIERADGARLFQGVPDSEGCATKMKLSSIGWTLHFAYTAAKGTLRLVSVDHHTSVEQSALEALREMAATKAVHEKKRKSAEDSLIESKKRPGITKEQEEEEEATTAPVQASRRY